MANFQRPYRPPTIDMTPMVDLGFLLIISFILTTILSKPKAIEMNEPRGCGSIDDIHDVKHYPLFNLVLTETPNVKFYTYQNGNQSLLDSVDLSKNGLRKLLSDRKQYLLEAFNGEVPFVLLVKATKNAKYKTLIDVLDELKISNAGFALRKLEAIDSVALHLN